MSELPRHVWLYWHQGEDSAPAIVKRCIASWRQRNPGWTVHVLDAGNVSEMSGLDQILITGRKDISLQFLSDLIRVALLTRHGGVWADATIYCARPLDEWLPERMGSGFFAFHGIRRGRLFGSPFLASTKANIIPLMLRERLLKLFGDRIFSGNTTWWGSKFRKVLKPVLELTPSTTRIWFTWFFTDALKLYPYFTLHYMFNKLVLEEPEFADTWARTPSMDPKLLVRIKRERSSGTVSGDLRDFIMSGLCPVHKLNWQNDADQTFWDEVFAILEEPDTSLGEQN